MSQHHYSHYETHIRKAAEFEAEENFANPAIATVKLYAVVDEQRRVCEGHTGGNPGCPCLVFEEVKSALRMASLGSSDPWAAVRAKRASVKALTRLRKGRSLAARINKSLQPEIAAKAVGMCLGEAYRHYLG